MSKPTGNEVYLKAFKLLEDNGIQKVAYNMIGLPYEKQEDIFKTIAMNKLCKTDTQTSGKFYPYKGTPIRRMLIEKGLLKEDKEKELLKGYDLNSLTDYQSVLDFNSIDTDLNAEILNKLSLLFGTYVIWPVKLWPLIDLIKNNNKENKFINILWEKINEVTYYKKFNQWPKNTEIKSNNLNKDIYNFEDEKANEFGNYLVSIWNNDTYSEKFHELLNDIEKPS